ncbi:hypothetical protein C8R47DRAFT_1184088 [Mycena vitilis]|nr:hypothetical protein C8R47DRAFT_1184088 [Mycena vitilis]
MRCLHEALGFASGTSCLLVWTLAICSRIMLGFVLQLCASINFGLCLSCLPAKSVSHPYSEYNPRCSSSGVWILFSSKSDHQGTTAVLLSGTDRRVRLNLP